MVFSSLLFLCLILPIFFAVYYSTPAKYKNAILLAASVALYAWGSPQFIGVVIASGLIDYRGSLALEKIKTSAHKKWLLAVLVTMNVGILAYAKYANFFVAQTNQLSAWFGHSPIPWSMIVLPLGISFMTFHKISYLVDVYRGTTQPAKTLWHYFLYLFLFPHLIAGPIVRYHVLAPELHQRTVRLVDISAGIERFIWGLAKKVLIANPLGQTVDLLFSMPLSQQPVWYAWIAVIGYTLQLYYDFSGYSDMAIGLARMCGFTFPENFNAPYQAISITDFWRRWHITLSAFMREYVYIPLGGSRKGEWKTARNLWLVFLLSGFWHGANWTFLIWGAYHGAWIVVEKVVGEKKLQKIPKSLRQAFTFFLVIIGWVLFRSENFSNAWHLLQKMFGALPHVQSAAVTLWRSDILPGRVSVVGILALVGVFFSSEKIRSRCKLSTWRLPVLFFALVLSVMSLAQAQFNPFIYFRF